jgi:hypothetical protein
MAMRLVVATTEATDTTRVRDPFRTTANVMEDLVIEAPWRCPVGFKDGTDWVVKNRRR